MFVLAKPERSRGRFTLVEAAALAGVEEKAARHALNDVLGRSAVPWLGARDVLFLLLRKATLSVASGTAVQVALYRRLHEPSFRAAANDEVSIDLDVTGGPTRVRLVIDQRVLVRDLLTRIRRFRKGARRVERRDDVVGGALVFKGTRVPVEHVGALLKGGVSPAVVKEDFPTLTDTDLEFARIVVELNPPRGRPRKRLELRRRSSVPGAEKS